MGAESPVWHHGRFSRESRVLHRNVLWSGTSKEVQIHNASESIILEVCTIRIINLDIHALRCGQKHAVCALRTSVVQIDRVRAVKVGSGWSTVSITVPELWFHQHLYRSRLCALTVRV
jgi:hypothetical protein